METNISESLKKGSHNSKKRLTVYLRMNLIEEVERIAKEYRVSKSITVSELLEFGLEELYKTNKQDTKEEEHNDGTGLSIGDASDGVSRHELGIEPSTTGIITDK